MHRISSHILQYQLVFSATAYLHVAAVSNPVYLWTLYLTLTVVVMSETTCHSSTLMWMGLYHFHIICVVQITLFVIYVLVAGSWIWTEAHILQLVTKKEKKGKKSLIPWYSVVRLIPQLFCSFFTLFFLLSNNTVKILYTFSSYNVHMIMNFINVNAAS